MINREIDTIKEKDIANILVTMGFRSDVSGYTYTVEGIKCMLECLQNGQDIPKMEYVYNKIAAKHKNLTYSKIERCVRYLICEWAPSTVVYERQVKELVENLATTDRLYPRTIMQSVANYLIYNHN